MSVAMQFVGRDYLDRSSKPIDRLIPDPGFAVRLIAEADDVHALLLWLGRADADKRWTRTEVTILLARTLASLDRCLNLQLNAILHHPHLQALEANWRGVWLLAEQAAHDDSEGLVRVRVLDLNWSVLSKDLSRSIEFDQSRLFAKIYSEEFGSPGGEPFGLLLGAYTLSHRTDGGQANLDTLKDLARLASAAFAPVVLNAAPSFFGVNSFSELSGVTELESHFSQPELAKWQALRDMADSRFLALAVPRMMMRAPYPDIGQGPEGFRFREERQKPETDYLWGPACFFGWGGCYSRFL